MALTDDSQFPRGVAIRRLFVFAVCVLAFVAVALLHARSADDGRWAVINTSAFLPEVIRLPVETAAPAAAPRHRHRHRKALKLDEPVTAPTFTPPRTRPGLDVLLSVADTALASAGLIDLSLIPESEFGGGPAANDLLTEPELTAVDLVELIGGPAAAATPASASGGGGFVIPEPATAGLLAASLTAIIARRRDRVAG